MKLKVTLQRRGLNPSWVAQQLDLERVRFWRILTGKSAMPVSKLRPLAKLLRISVDEALKLVE